MQIPSLWRKGLRSLRLKLSDYLEITEKPQGHGRELEAAGRWVRWKRSMPRHFPEAIRRTLRFVVYQTPPPSSAHRLCLCLNIPKCRRKPPGQRENFACPKFAFGVCVSATFHANKGQTMPIEIIGALSGMSKQGFCRHARAAQKMMVERILNDPELADFCRQLGVGGDLPAEELKIDDAS